MSSDGRFVIFSSIATNLTTAGTDGIFVHDRDTDTDGVFDEPGAIATVQVDTMIPLVPSMSGDARFVSFGAFFDVPALGDTNGFPDLLIQDTCRGVAAGCTPQTVLASVATDGTQGDDQSGQHTLSPDGRFMVFDSDATNLVANDNNGLRDVFWRDTCFGVSTACTPSTVRVSVASDGSEGNDNGFMTRFGMYGASQGGRLVVFASPASNLVTGDTNGVADLFVRDTCFGTTGCTPSTVRVSVASDGSEGNNAVSTTGFSMSADGAVVAFASLASNMVPGDTNSVSDIFLASTGLGGGGAGGGNPVPAIATITPATVTVGGADFTLTVDGTGFITSSVAQVDGANRATTFISATQLEATVLASDIAVAGTANVTVVNPGPGGGTSNIAVLNINNPAPTITTLTPSNATEGGPAFTLTVDGSSFISSSVVRWNGNDRTTTFVSNTQLTADILATDIATAGSASVTVFNPTPGGGTSNAVTFTISAPAPCTVGVGTRFSVASDGTPGNDDSDRPALSADGRYIAFQSLATNLVANDTNATTDIFVHDRDADNDGIFDEPGAINTVRVSVAGDGTQADGSSAFASMSPDGRFVAFQSGATNLVANDTNGLVDVFVHDRDADNDGIFDEAGAISTVRVSVLSDGSQPNDTSRLPVISPDGRFTAFTSPATDLVPGDTNGNWDVFVHDRDTDNDGIFDEPGAISTVRVTVASDGSEAAPTATLPGGHSISADGRFVAFHSTSTNLVAGGITAQSVFLHDRDVDEDGVFDEPGQIATIIVSVAGDGTQGNGPSTNSAMSADGRFITFESLATNLVASDANGSSGDIYIHDRDADEDGIFDEAGAIATILVSVASDGTQGNNASDDVDINDDGRFVVFRSFATNLVANDTTSTIDIFVHDRDTDEDGVFDEAGAIETVRVSVASDGTEANLAGLIPAISGDGSAVVFSSDANNLVLNDTNVARDIFGGEACLVASGGGGGGGGNPVPGITTLTPSSATEGGPAFMLTVDGSSFISSSVVRWDGSDRTTTFVSDTQLTADILAADIAAAGSPSVTVFNPAPGGGTSNAVTFTINPALTPGVQERVSVAFDGSEGDGTSYAPTVSADGRFVAFASVATNLVPSDNNFEADIFVRDTCRGAPMGCMPTTARVSVASDGTEGDLGSGPTLMGHPAISDDGRFVAFLSRATNLVAGDTNDALDVFLHDRDADNDGIFDEAGAISTMRVSVASDGTEANATNGNGIVSMSSDARFVAFASGASNLVAGDTNGRSDVFVRDTCIGAPVGCVPSTTRASVAFDGAQGTGDSLDPTISPDGRFVTFASLASNLVPGGTGSGRSFLRDTCIGAPGGCIPTTVHVSKASDGTDANNLSGGQPVSSADGRFVAFIAGGTNLAPGDTNGQNDIFVHDRDADDDGVFDEPGSVATIRVSVADDGSEIAGVNTSGFERDNDTDESGRLVVFVPSTDLPGDTNLFFDVFLRDTCLGATGCTPATILLSVASGGVQGNGFSQDFSISRDGRWVAFASDATNLTPGDTNDRRDIFLAATGF